jgi:hypothetical protein
MGTLFDRSRRFPTTAPRLATPRVPTRNDLLALRERLAREEREAAARLDKLRGELDELSNQLGVAGPAPMRESERNPALWMINQDRSRRGLPPLAEVPPGPAQPKRGGPIDAAATAKAIVSAGKRARGEDNND